MTPIPNKDPVGYLKVPAAFCCVSEVPSMYPRHATCNRAVWCEIYTALRCMPPARGAGPAGDRCLREGPPVRAGVHRAVQVQTGLFARAIVCMQGECNLLLCHATQTTHASAFSLHIALVAKLSQATKVPVHCEECRRLDVQMKYRQHDEIDECVDNMCRPAGTLG